MNPSTTALILVGYQNDYFAKDGILRGMFEEPGSVDSVLDHTLHLIRELASTDALIVATPIVLDADYRALANPVGILSAIKQSGAFSVGTQGAEPVPELAEFDGRLIEVGGKMGFNAFSNTQLDEVLAARGIRDVLVCGMITSLCIDSTARAAYERGFDVTVVSDCSAGRTKVEHEFFCGNVFPLYGQALTSAEVLMAMTGAPA